MGPDTMLFKMSMMMILAVVAMIAFPVSAAITKKQFDDVKETMHDDWDCMFEFRVYGKSNGRGRKKVIVTGFEKNCLITDKGKFEREHIDKVEWRERNDTYPFKFPTKWIIHWKQQRRDLPQRIRKAT